MSFKISFPFEVYSEIKSNPNPPFGVSVFTREEIITLIRISIKFVNKFENNYNANEEKDKINYATFESEVAIFVIGLEIKINFLPFVLFIYFIYCFMINMFFEASIY